MILDASDSANQDWARENMLKSGCFLTYTNITFCLIYKIALPLIILIISKEFPGKIFSGTDSSKMP